MARQKIKGISISSANAAGSANATSGYVLKADGSGGAAWGADSIVAGISSSADATAITIDSSERVGIGTTTPDYPVEIEANNLSSGLPQFVVKGKDNDLTGIGLVAYGSNASHRNWGISANQTAAGAFNIGYTANATNAPSTGNITSAFFIDSSGKVGIGSTSPDGILHLKSSAPVFTMESTTNSSSRTWDFATERVEGGDLSIRVGTSLAATPSVTSMYFKSNGNVGIGTTSPDSLLHMESGNAHNKLSITSTASGGTGYDAAIDLLGSATNSEVQLNMGINGDADREQIKTYQSAMSFRTNNTERMRILSSGGITFNGDTAAANALDDYEEGTWQPGNNGTQFSTRNGSYTKIGDRVFCQFEVIAGSGSSTGDWYGLPFTIRNSSDLGRGGGVVAYHNENNSESWHVSTENVNSTTFSIRMGSAQKQLTSGKRAWGFFSYLV